MIRRKENEKRKTAMTKPRTEHINLKNDLYNLLAPALPVENVEGSLVMGCNFLFKSRRIDVFGCQSRNASLNALISAPKKCATRSSAMMSRNDHGI